jgi:hypothetical protein
MFKDKLKQVNIQIPAAEAYKNISQKHRKSLNKLAK